MSSNKLDKVISVKGIQDLEQKVRKCVDEAVAKIAEYSTDDEWKMDLTDFIMLQVRKEGFTLRALYVDLGEGDDGGIIDDDEIRSALVESLYNQLEGSKEPTSTAKATTATSSEKKPTGRIIAPLSVGRDGKTDKTATGTKNLNDEDARRAAREARFGKVPEKEKPAVENKSNSNVGGGKRSVHDTNEGGGRNNYNNKDNNNRNNHNSNNNNNSSSDNNKHNNNDYKRQRNDSKNQSGQNQPPAAPPAAPAAGMGMGMGMSLDPAQFAMMVAAAAKLLAAEQQNAAPPPAAHHYSKPKFAPPPPAAPGVLVPNEKKPGTFISSNYKGKNPKPELFEGLATDAAVATGADGSAARKIKSLAAIPGAQRPKPKPKEWVNESVL